MYGIVWKKVIEEDDNTVDDKEQKEKSSFKMEEEVYNEFDKIMKKLSSREYNVDL